MSDLIVLFMLAAVTEAVWEGLKPLWPGRLRRLEKEKGAPVDRTGVLLCAIGAAFAARLDLACALDLPFDLPVAGTLVSGILGGRIANLWHDCLGTIDGIRRDKKPLELESGL